MCFFYNCFIHWCNNKHFLLLSMLERVVLLNLLVETMIRLTNFFNG